MIFKGGPAEDGRLDIRFGLAILSASSMAYANVGIE